MMVLRRGQFLEAPVPNEYTDGHLFDQPAMGVNWLEHFMLTNAHVADMLSVSDADALVRDRSFCVDTADNKGVCDDGARAHRRGCTAHGARRICTLFICTASTLHLSAG